MSAQQHPGTGVVGKLRTAALNRAHRYLFDRIYLGREIHPTSRIVAANDLGFPDALRQHSAEYAPTPCLCVHWAISGLAVDVSDYAFVDIGSGRGRVLMMAAQYPFQQVTGIELDGDLAARAQENIDAMPASRRKARTVQSLRANALEVDLPPIPTIFFLFNPFDAEITRAFLTRLQARGPLNARDIVVFVNLKYDSVLEEFGYRRLPGRTTTRALSAALSPYPIAAFKSVGPKHLTPQNFIGHPSLSYQGSIPPVPAAPPDAH